MCFQVELGNGDFPVEKLQTRKRRGMSIQSDRWIGEQAIHHRVIEPSSEKQVASGVISCGLSSYGYDLRVSQRVQDIYQCEQRHHRSKVVRRAFICSVQANSAIIPPNSFALARPVEYFEFPGMY